MTACQYQFFTFPFVFKRIQPRYKPSGCSGQVLLPLGVRVRAPDAGSATHKVDHLKFRSSLDAAIFPLCFSNDFSIQLNCHPIDGKAQKHKRFCKS